MFVDYTGFIDDDIANMAAEICGICEEIDNFS